MDTPNPTQNPGPVPKPPQPTPHIDLPNNVSSIINSPSTGSSYTYNSPSSGSRWVYIVIAIVVLLGVGGGAYYLLGAKKSEETPQQQQQPVNNKLTKAWLNNYFNTEVCPDAKVCGEAADPDNDGFSNIDESKANTIPIDSDTDEDGISDGDEVHIYKTEPTLKYTDRRDIVSKNDWTDSYQIRGGYDPNTPGVKYTAARLKEIAEATTKYKLHEPTPTTLGISATPSPSPTSSTKTDEITKVSSGYSYKNLEYGFTLTLTTAWEGLSTRKTPDGTLQGVAHVYFQVPIGGQCTKTPNQVTGDCYAAPMAITVYPIAQWEKVKNTTGIGSAIAQNTQFAFTATPWQESPASLTKINFEISKVIATFKLTK